MRLKAFRIRTQRGNQITRLKEVFANSIFIKPHLDLLQWAQEYRVLSKESSALFGKFNVLSYQKEPMQAISDPSITEVVLMWGAQLGKSEILNNAIGYFIHQDPSTILFLLPTEDLAQDYSKRRLAPMFRDIPQLQELIDDKEANNTILTKNFKGGNLALVGSNSPSKLSSKPIKVLIVDECDRCMNTKEGHSIALAQKRTATYFDKKIIKVSTPTLKGHSYIEREFESSDKRFFLVPCPHCAFEQTLVLSGVVYDLDAQQKPLYHTIAYKCMECGGLWSEVQKQQAVNAGKWVATNANEHTAQKAGFFLNALYSPFVSMTEIIKDYYSALGNPSSMQVFTNTQEAMPYEPPSVIFAEQALYVRREDYSATNLPDDIRFITAGVDVQTDRLEVEFKGWGNGYESWGVKHLVLRGKTDDGQVWGHLYQQLKQIFYTTSGRRLVSSLNLIDSGFNAEIVYNFVKKDPRFMASKGHSEQSGKKPIIEKPRLLAKGVKFCNVGTYKAKSEIFRFLGVENIGPGYCHFPLDYHLEYFQQLTAEKLEKSVNTRGYESLRWVKIKERNEALDLFVLNLAAAKLLKVLDQINPNTGDKHG
ncbi:phage terminase large subunit family protein [Helicobacter cynogastricus]|uniref:phage terminase large subunit family protein n=1 Tax=Helicobacter cynogastricus TaxID=329937 RepID=UPI000CF189ED|nr:terminase gpA endonuclease subunit [Helicobacter cynogastricus]